MKCPAYLPLYRPLSSTLLHCSCLPYPPPAGHRQLLCAAGHRVPQPVGPRGPPWRIHLPRPQRLRWRQQRPAQEPGCCGRCVSRRASLATQQKHGRALAGGTTRPAARLAHVCPHNSPTTAPAIRPPLQPHKPNNFTSVPRPFIPSFHPASPASPMPPSVLPHIL